ncbi:hypothetical protein ACE5IS_12115 [Leptospira wolffii]|uniref:Cytochrome B n=1 Tax=Leptospira wolffii TaxID=409998 RepID=A0ABV5BNR6_9LEPT
MYTVLLFLHSYNRWLVLVLLALCLLVSCFALIYRKEIASGFLKHLHLITTSVLHLQLVLGLIVYFKSPFVRAFFTNAKENFASLELSFFSVFHALAMFSAVVIFTVGSAKAKRESDQNRKHRIVLSWFTSALFLIVVAIPWPIISVVTRPLFRIP